MSIVLFRVDERLIHGQVVVGWAELHPDRIVVVDDEIAASQWEQELYAMGLPSEVTPEFEPVVDARGMLATWRTGGERVVVLTRDVATMHKLAEGGVMNFSDGGQIRRFGPSDAHAFHIGWRRNAAN